MSGGDVNPRIMTWPFTSEKSELNLQIIRKGQFSDDDKSRLDSLTRNGVGAGHQQGRARLQ